MIILFQSPSDREALAKRMRQVESDRQDVYLKTLRKRGQLVALPDGGDKLVSHAQMPLFLPNVLKHKDSLDQWLPREKVWLNL